MVNALVHRVVSTGPKKGLYNPMVGSALFSESAAAVVYLATSVV